MGKPDQIRWNAARRSKYALLIRERRPWDKAGVKSQKGKSVVRFNGIKTGQNAAPILAIKRLLYQTLKLLNLYR